MRVPERVFSLFSAFYAKERGESREIRRKRVREREELPEPGD